MSWYSGGAGYGSGRAIAGGDLNWDLGLERLTNGTGVIGSETTTTAITIGRTGITTTFPGAVTITQTLTTSGIVSLAAGTSLAPSLTFTGDTNLGLYRSAADTLGFAASDVSIGTWSATALVVTQAVGTTGSPTALTITGGAHTTLAASTEATDVLFDLARTVQFATGALTTQRAVQVEAPTYAFVGASTLTNATTFDVLAAPTAGSFATFTNTRVMRLAGAVTIGATSASMTYSVIDIPAHTVTVSGSTQVTSASMASAIRLGAITITDGDAVTIDAASTLYIAGPPVGAGSVTLTAPLALFIDSGNTRLDGTLGVGGAPTAAIQCTITEAVNTSGSPTAFLVTGGAHTTITASAEAVGANFNLSATVQWAQGALTTQRQFLIQAGTFAFATGSSTVTNATTFDITSAPAAGTNAVFTNTRVMRLAGNVTIGATSASMTYSVIDVPSHSVTLTGSTQVTSASMAAAVRLGAITLTDADAVTIDTASTLYIAGPPVAAGSVTLSAALSMFVDTGNVRLDGQAVIGGTTSTITGTLDLYHDSDVRQGLRITNTKSGGLTWALSDGVAVTGAFTLWDATNSRVGLTVSTSAGGTTTFNGSSIGVAWTCNTSAATFTQVVATTGSPTAFKVTAAAHTTLTASAEAISVNFDLNATKQFAQGALTTQRAVLIQAEVLAFATGSSTVTNATTFDIDAAPTASTNAVFTNTRIVRLGGNVTIGATAAGMTYTGIDIPAHTVTVTGSTQVTSASMASAIRLGIITITDGDAVTIDTASTLYIAGVPAAAGSVTLSAAYAIHVDAGRSRFDDSVLVGATTVGTNSPTNLVVIGNGTVPTSSPNDSITLYSTDNSAGNTIPSFYCEGTEVIATGQADSASSVRVKMRINGTVATFLCI